MASIPALKTKTAIADSTGVAAWSGTNGIKAQMEDIANLLLQRGVLVVESTTLLALMGAADTQIAIVKDVALYAYNASSPTNGASPLDIPANGGGRWQFIVAVGDAEYSEVIGDSLATSFTITHGLNTLYPTVLQMEPSAPGGGVPFTYSTDGTVTVTNANTITVAYLNPPGTQQFTIVVKK